MARRTSPEADDDFAQIYLFGIEHFGKREAEAYALALLDMLDALGANPGLGVQRVDATPPVRLFPFRSHNILYFEEPDGAFILRIVHGSTDWLALFTKDKD